MSSASTSSQRFEEAHFTFALTPQQVQQILTSRFVSLSPPASSLGGYPETPLSDFLLFFFAPLLTILLHLLCPSFSCVSRLYPLDI